MKTALQQIWERTSSVCKGIANTNWYYYSVCVLSAIMVITAVFHLHNRDYLRCLWDAFVAFVMFFGNRFRIVRKPVENTYKNSVSDLLEK